MFKVKHGICRCRYCKGRRGKNSKGKNTLRDIMVRQFNKHVRIEFKKESKAALSGKEYEPHLKKGGYSD